jgi:hypothetical protein
MTFAAIYALVVGVAMIGQWTVSIVRKQVPELETERARITFHLAGEFITALALLASGSGLLLDACWGLEAYLVAVGMLFYTIIVSPGYFAQKRQWPMVGLFAVLIVLAIVSLVLVL